MHHLLYIEINSSTHPTSISWNTHSSLYWYLFLFFVVVPVLYLPLDGAMMIYILLYELQLQLSCMIATRYYTGCINICSEEARVELERGRWLLSACLVIIWYEPELDVGRSNVISRLTTLAAHYTSSSRSRASLAFSSYIASLSNCCRVSVSLLGDRLSNFYNENRGSILSNFNWYIIRLDSLY